MKILLTFLFKRNGDDSYFLNDVNLIVFLFPLSALLSKLMAHFAPEQMRLLNDVANIMRLYHTVL